MLALDIPPGPDWFTAGALNGSQIRQLRGRVEVTLPREAWNQEDPSWFAEGQIRRFPSGVELTARGRMNRLIVDMALGDPWDKDTRFGAAELVEKLRSYASPLAPGDSRWRQQLDLLADTLLSLERVGNVCEVRRLLRR